VEVLTTGSGRLLNGDSGRLKVDWGLLPLRVRRLPRVTLHANLTILAQLASALLITRDT
jgi:hypothetical protein